MAGIATASPTKNILMTMSATVFPWAVWGPPRRWPTSSLFWRRRAPIGSMAETYRSMGWSNPTRPWIDGHFSVWRGMVPDDRHRCFLGSLNGRLNRSDLSPLITDTHAGSEATE